MAFRAKFVNFFMILAAFFGVLLCSSAAYASKKPLFTAECEGGFASGLNLAHLQISKEFKLQNYGESSSYNLTDEKLKQLAIDFQKGSVQKFIGANPYKLFEKLIYDLERALHIIAPEGLADVEFLKKHLFTSGTENQIFANFDLRAARDQNSLTASLRILAGIEWIGAIWSYYSEDLNLANITDQNDSNSLIPFKRLNLQNIENLNMLLNSIEKVISVVPQDISLMPKGWRAVFPIAFVKSTGNSYHKIPEGSPLISIGLDMRRTLRNLSFAEGSTEQFFNRILNAIESKLISAGIDKTSEIDFLRSRFVVDPKYLEMNRFFGNQDMTQARSTSAVGLQPALRINLALQWVFRFWVHNYPDSKLVNEGDFYEADPLQMGWRYDVEDIRVLNLFLSEIGL